VRYLRVALCVWAAVFVALEYRRESTHEGTPMSLGDFALYYHLR